MCFHFRGSIKPIFENHVFRPVSEPFHPLYEAKISNRCQSVVYGSITLKFFRGLWELVRTSGSTAKTKFQKSVFWDTLVIIIIVMILKCQPTLPPRVAGNRVVKYTVTRYRVVRNTVGRNQVARSTVVRNTSQVPLWRGKADGRGPGSALQVENQPISTHSK